MFDEYMLRFGYSDEQIENIKSSYPLNTYKEATLLYNTKNLINYLHRNTFDNESIIKLTTTLPQIISISIESLRVRVDDMCEYGFSKLEVFNMMKQYPYVANMSFQRINNRYDTFMELGFIKNDINHIFLNKASILNVDPSIIKKHYDFFIEYGYKNKDIIYLFKCLPDLIDISFAKLNSKLDDLVGMGFKASEIIKISICFPKILVLDIEELTVRVASLTNFGYSTKSIINIIKKIPGILKENYSSKIDSVIEYLEDNGFSKTDIIGITEANSYIFLFSLDTLKNNYDNFINNNLYSLEIVEMINTCPLLLTYNSSIINDRLSFYSKQGLIKHIKNNSSLLLISLDFVKRRFVVVKDKDKDDVFLDDISFMNKYNITREELMEGAK